MRTTELPNPVVQQARHSHFSLQFGRKWTSVAGHLRCARTPMKCYILISGLSKVLLYSGCTTPEQQQGVMRQPVVVTNVATTTLRNGFMDLGFFEAPLGLGSSDYFLVAPHFTDFPVPSPENVGKPEDVAAVKETVLASLPILKSVQPLIRIHWVCTAGAIVQVSTPECETVLWVGSMNKANG